jgi:hypothetical protein
MSTSIQPIRSCLTASGVALSTFSYFQQNDLANSRQVSVAFSSSLEA